MGSTVANELYLTLYCCLYTVAQNKFPDLGYVQITKQCHFLINAYNLKVCQFIYIVLLLQDLTVNTPQLYNPMQYSGH